MRLTWANCKALSQEGSKGWRRGKKKELEIRRDEGKRGGKGEVEGREDRRTKEGKKERELSVTAAILLAPS